MKTPLRLALAVAFATAAFPAQEKVPAPVKSLNASLEKELPPDAHQLALGDAAPDFHLKGVDGKFYSLADFPASKAPVLMVVFLSNHCPVSHAAETRLIPLAREFAGQGLAVVAINPNSPEGLSITELGYSKYNDSYEEMILYAKEKGFVFPYVYDGETQATGKAYGCLATPHVFLFDAQRKLRYSGRVDDSRFEDPKTVKSPDARNAIVQLLAGQPVTVTSTLVSGCSTKWNTKKGAVAALDEKWKAEPVELATIDAAGVAQLAKNASKRYRLINVWATWCAPCVAEFPDLVSLSRRLGDREFEFITISADDPKMRAQAKAFLERQHAVPSPRLKKLLAAEGRPGTNFLYTDPSADDLVRALDPAWPGPLPHTVLIAPGGKIVYRHNGPVEPAELLAKIIAEIGPSYTP